MFRCYQATSSHLYGFISLSVKTKYLVIFFFLNVISRLVNFSFKVTSGQMVFFFFLYLSLHDCHLVFPKHMLYVSVRFTCCTIPLEIITHYTDSFPIFLHIPCPTTNPTVKLQNLFGAIQTQKIYQYVVVILLLTDKWMYVHKYRWPGMSFQLFP